ncbi:adenylate/guanylate cyclase domain-containing protein [Microvirga aerophila]|uniref:Guanylyl cyclase n=1 Tax=Microvirga aerophila TaxID=670291 RepID=A0A512C4E4_9HYPH|nr:adenylate/guanylate cyclase domain-containing protein [Microvirga aerophila]GEO19096.1 guanylyl cyclase [Microvirga aerophila]
MERKLVTIVCADVAGYSRLIGLDEEGTIARLKASRRALIDPAIARHGGRLVKTMGDGLLVEFASPVEAVRCAAELQLAMASRETSFPEEHRIRFRIGINLGDVVIEDGDVLGDGVNIAARLQALADVGGICVSRSIRDQVRDRLPVEFEDLGEQSVRNIARPVRCYRVHFDAYTANASSEAPDRRRWLVPVAAAVALVVLGGTGFFLARNQGPSKPSTTPVAAAAPNTVGADPSRTASRLSLVVLPFDNLSGDPDQEYFADGLTEDLTADLSRIDGSFVIARNTAFTYKNKPVDIRQIGRDLSVRYVLEGSVRRSSSLVRVNAQLIDAETGAHLWAERFDRPRADLIEMQNEITAGIASALRVKLIDIESRRGQRERPVNPDSTDLAMRGWALIYASQTRDNNAAARRLFEEALKVDPHVVIALTGLGFTHIRDVLNRWTDAPADPLQKADELIAQAIVLKPDDAAAHQYKALLRRAQRRSAEAIAAAERAVSLNRNLAVPYTEMGWNYALLGQPEKTEGYVRQGIRLSPRDPFLVYWLLYIGGAQLHLGQDEAAVETIQQAIDADPGFPSSYGWLAAAYVFTGREAEAREPMVRWLRAVPGMTLTRYKALEQSDHPAYVAQRSRIYAAWRKLGMPE